MDFNKIINNGYGIVNFVSGLTADAIYNYWGCDAGPFGTGCDECYGAEYDPWLIDPDSDRVFESSDGIGDVCDPTPTGPGAGAGPGPRARLRFGQLIPVTGGELVELSCTQANTLELPGGQSIAFGAVLCGYSAQLATETVETLPGELPAGSEFAAGLTLNLLLDGESATGQSYTLSFAIPADMEGSDFAILAWDAEAGVWVDAGAVIVAGGFVTITVDYPGTFVLVAQ